MSLLPLAILKPKTFLEASAWLMRDERPSSHNNDKLGENGSPYLRPFLDKKGVPGWPLIITEYETIET